MKHFTFIAEDDVHAIMAYVRTLPSVASSVPESTPDFPMNLILATIPEPCSPMRRPDPGDVVACGKYMATIAACADCHTPADAQGKKLPGMELAGGMEFFAPWGVVRALNLTPDPETGIGGWDKLFFVNRFKTYATPEGQREVVNPGEFNTVMPWTMYAGMTEEDLGAIYEYLRTLTPVKHKVEKHTPPKS